MVERLSGKNFIRPEYKRVMKKLRGGDHTVKNQGTGRAITFKESLDSEIGKTQSFWESLHW